jgi:hypothetical protein
VSSINFYNSFEFNVLGHQFLESGVSGNLLENEKLETVPFVSRGHSTVNDLAMQLLGNGEERPCTNGAPLETADNP